MPVDFDDEEQVRILAEKVETGMPYDEAVEEAETVIGYLKRWNVMLAESNLKSLTDKERAVVDIIRQMSLANAEMIEYLTKNPSKFLRE